ncbi:hypothetical protein GA0061105_1322 [Rhizobium aethiopicum]|uniref:Uncharacterized protein n=1 Tax=Rhizobium aethiopicum TaxID=1138170 RepID=A0A1C3YCS9_9HYPH|nr:hypothetical protein GA0061105_1322 [Rhizobium aethiopicum]
MASLSCLMAVKGIERATSWIMGYCDWNLVEMAQVLTEIVRQAEQSHFGARMLDTSSNLDEMIGVSKALGKVFVRSGPPGLRRTGRK